MQYDFHAVIIKSATMFQKSYYLQIKTHGKVKVSIQGIKTIDIQVSEHLHFVQLTSDTRMCLYCQVVKAVSLQELRK